MSKDPDPPKTPFKRRAGRAWSLLLETLKSGWGLVELLGTVGFSLLASQAPWLTNFYNRPYFWSAMVGAWSLMFVITLAFKSAGRIATTEIQAFSEQSAKIMAEGNERSAKTELQIERDKYEGLLEKARYYEGATDKAELEVWRLKAIERQKNSDYWQKARVLRALMEGYLNNVRDVQMGKNILSHNRSRG